MFKDKLHHLNTDFINQIWFCVLKLERRNTFKQIVLNCWALFFAQQFVNKLGELIFDTKMMSFYKMFDHSSTLCLMIN